MTDKEALKWFCENDGKITIKYTEMDDFVITFWVGKIYIAFTSSALIGRLDINPFQYYIIPEICALRKEIENG